MILSLLTKILYDSKYFNTVLNVIYAVYQSRSLWNKRIYKQLTWEKPQNFS